MMASRVSYIELVGKNLGKDRKTPKSRKYSLPNALIQISLDSKALQQKQTFYR